jgi:hypothetical protein
MKDELMICPKAGSCGGNCALHWKVHKKNECCELSLFNCPACEIFLGVVVKDERRIDDMSEGRELSESKATNA